MSNLFLKQRKRNKYQSKAKKYQSKAKKKSVAKNKTLKNRYKRIIKGGMFPEFDMKIGDKISVLNWELLNVLDKEEYVNAEIVSIYNFKTDNYETKATELFTYWNIQSEDNFNDFVEYREKVEGEEKGKMTKIYFIKYDNEQTYQKIEFDPTKALDYLKETLEKRELDQESLDDYIKETYAVELFREGELLSIKFKSFLKKKLGIEIISSIRKKFYNETTKSLTRKEGAVFVYEQGFNFQNYLY